MKPNQMAGTLFSAGVFALGLASLAIAAVLLGRTFQEAKESALPAMTLMEALADDSAETSQDPEATRSWPWGDEKPGWGHSQAHPEDYAEWLASENPGYSVQLITNGMVTAYTPGVESCGEFADGYTATMQDASQPGIAVPKVHLRDYRKRGVIVDVPGYGRYVPDDTGGALNRSLEEGHFHVDIRYQEVQVCYEWGRKTGVLFVLVPD